jgi:hypothetical protein
LTVGVNQPIRTSCVSILKAAASQLLTALGGAGGTGFTLDSSGIFLSCRPQMPHFQAEQDILLRPFGFRIDQGRDLAGGRYTTVFTRRLGATLRTRANLDESFKDQVWYQGDAGIVLGHSALEEAVVDALHEFTPTDSNSNALTVEPMKIIEGNDPSKLMNDQNSWGWSLLMFSIVYMPPLNQAIQ